MDRSPRDVAERNTNHGISVVDSNVLGKYIIEDITKFLRVLNIGLSKTILRALVLREILSTNSLKVDQYMFYKK